MEEKVGVFTLTGDFDERHITDVEDIVNRGKLFHIPWYVFLRLNPEPKIYFNADYDGLGGLLRGTTAEIWGAYHSWSDHYQGGTRWAVGHELGHMFDKNIRPDRHELHRVFHNSSPDHYHMVNMTADLPNPPGIEHAPHGWGGSGRTPHSRAGSEAFAEWFAWSLGLHSRTNYGEHNWHSYEQRRELQDIVEDAIMTTQIFSDVPPDSTHAEAIHWAAENGLIKGREDGTFGPGANVTRGQLCTILKSYSERS